MTATITDQGTGTPTGGATGRVSRVIGPVIDAEFPANAMPEIYNALTTEIDLNGQRRTVTFEVAQHLGDNMVRAISMDTTEGLTRGQPVTDTGSSIQAPVGPGTLGRIMNVVGQPIDEAGPILTSEYRPIHKDAPTFDEQSTSSEILVTGIKVIDLSRVLGGPYCTQALADHGAQVIKLEPPGGDETRGWGPPFYGDTAWYFAGVNRNKQGIAVDLSCEAGRDILWKLLEDADVLVENFKPGTLARWGMDYERDLRERFPKLIHCAVSGFGPDGPLGGLPGYDAAIQAMTGLMSVNGERDGPATRVGLPVVDMVTGLNALAGILLALADFFEGQGIALESVACSRYQAMQTGADMKTKYKETSRGGLAVNIVEC